MNVTTRTTRRVFVGGLGMAACSVTVPGSSAARPPSSVFADRLAAWRHANAMFEREGNEPGVTDERADYLCRQACDAYSALQDTPAPDITAIVHKLKAMTDWGVGADIPTEDIEALGREAAAILTRHGED